MEGLSKSEIQYLSENLFFYSDDDAIRYFMGEISPKELHIIVSVTELCNLRCAYCYENNAEIRGVMSFDILDKIKLYITWKHFVKGGGVWMKVIKPASYDGDIQCGPVWAKKCKGEIKAGN